MGFGAYLSTGTGSTFLIYCFYYFLSFLEFSLPNTTAFVSCCLKLNNKLEGLVDYTTHSLNGLDNSERIIIYIKVYSERRF